MTSTTNKVINTAIVLLVRLSIAAVIAVFFSILATSPVYAQECPGFTPEQHVLIQKAKAIGDYNDLGYTLAAIVWREAIVGQYIVRVNGGDGAEGSYGVAQMQITTAAYLTGEDNLWRAKAVLAPALINNDTVALKLGLQYLNTHAHLGWRAMIARYNGKGPMARAYARDVVGRVKILQTCLYYG